MTDIYEEAYKEAEIKIKKLSEDFKKDLDKIFKECTYVNYEDMIGCVGWFKQNKDTVDECSVFGILDKYDKNSITGKKFYCRSDTWYKYFTPAKKSQFKIYGDEE